MWRRIGMPSSFEKGKRKTGIKLGKEEANHNNVLEFL